VDQFWWVYTVGDKLPTTNLVVSGNPRSGVPETTERYGRGSRRELPRPAVYSPFVVGDLSPTFYNNASIAALNFLKLTGLLK
jgi:hypothetical protein